MLTTAGAWATGGSLNTGRRNMAGAGVSNSSALGFGGDSPPTPGYANTESYNGSSWTEVADLNTARGNAGGNGTQTSALAFGGTPNPAKTVTEQWNGSSWTEVNDLNLARTQLMGFGIKTSAIACGGEGDFGPPPQSANTES